jgi:DNA processing protein
VLHIVGDAQRSLASLAGPTVAVVGSRRPSEYAVEVARSLGRGLAASGITVLSGMAAGIDSAAHAGALEVAGAPTVAVLPGGPERPYPAAGRHLHRRIAAAGAVVSELPPGTAVRRWMFPARNRIVAGLAAVTVVVEAGAGSGALFAAAVARELRRPVGAVPGRVTSPLADGPNGLLAEGAHVVRGPHDVIELVSGWSGSVPEAPGSSLPQPPSELRGLLRALGSGLETAAALHGAGFGLQETLAGLAALELSGHVRRAAGGRFTVVCKG